MYLQSKKTQKMKVGAIPLNRATLSPAARDFAALLAEIAFRRIQAARYKPHVEKK